MILSRRHFLIFLSSDLVVVYFSYFFHVVFSLPLTPLAPFFWLGMWLQKEMVYGYMGQRYRGMRLYDY